MTENEILDNATIEVLLDSLSGDKEFLAELMEDFFTDGSLRIKIMNDAITNDDAEAFSRAAHSMKSNAISFGAQEFSRFCQELENIGKTGEIHDVGSQLKKFEQDFQTVKNALKEYISK